jgi:hypothetical protein
VPRKFAAPAYTSSRRPVIPVPGVRDDDVASLRDVA